MHLMPIIVAGLGSWLPQSCSQRNFVPDANERTNERRHNYETCTREDGDWHSPCSICVHVIRFDEVNDDISCRQNVVRDERNFIFAKNRSRRRMLETGATGSSAHEILFFFFFLFFFCSRRARDRSRGAARYSGCYCRLRGSRSPNLPSERINSRRRRERTSVASERE